MSGEIFDIAAEEILGIGAPDAFLLFPDGCDVAKRYRQIAKIWHPDLNSHPLASDVMSHVAAIRDALVSGTRPCSPKERTYMSKTGPAVRFRYLKSRTSDTGDVLVGRRSIAYELSGEFPDVADAEVSAIGNLRFADAAMRAQMENFLPRVEKLLRADDLFVTILARNEDCVLLSDLVDHLGGRLPARHVAWIVSGLLNICCYLDWMKISHGAISPNTVLVCPERHSVVLVGGWGFSTAYGKRPVAVTERTLSKVPRLAVEGAVADGATDLKLVRALARDAIGSTAGLMKDEDVPTALAQWLLLPPRKDAPSDYESWGKCLTDAWGPRRFVRLEGADPRKIYSTP